MSMSLKVDGMNGLRPGIRQKRSKAPELRASAIFNLLLYNIMFIVPPVALFVSTFFGVTSEKMALIRSYKGNLRQLLSDEYILER